LYHRCRYRGVVQSTDGNVNKAQIGLKGQWRPTLGTEPALDQIRTTKALWLAAGPTQPGR
jgi:hypothetical protein